MIRRCQPVQCTTGPSQRFQRYFLKKSQANAAKETCATEHTWQTSTVAMQWQARITTMRM